MKRRILIIGQGNPSVHKVKEAHQNNLYAGILAGYLSAKRIGEVTLTDDPTILSSGELSSYDVCIVLNHTEVPPKWTESDVNGLVEFVKNGKGCVAVHTASLLRQGGEKFIEMLGGNLPRTVWGKCPTIEFQVSVRDPEHPVTKGVKDFKIYDEFYHEMEYDPASVRVLLTAQWEGKDEPMAWVRQHGKGRVVYFSFGHDLGGWLNPIFLKILEQGTIWACHGT